jgi:hypothetical protein
MIFLIKIIADTTLIDYINITSNYFPTCKALLQQFG